MSTPAVPIVSAPQSWYLGCELESLYQESYNPNTMANCPAGFSQNSTWAVPDPVLAMPSLAPNSAATTNVATAVINGGSDGTTAVAATVGNAGPGQSIGPASLTNAIPTVLPPWWNSGPPKPPSFSDQVNAWACANPALAALAVGGVFFMFARGGKKR